MIEPAPRRATEGESNGYICLRRCRKINWRQHRGQRRTACATMPSRQQLMATTSRLGIRYETISSSPIELGGINRAIWIERVPNLIASPETVVSCRAAACRAGSAGLPAAADPLVAISIGHWLGRHSSGLQIGSSPGPLQSRSEAAIGGARWSSGPREASALLER